MIDLISVLYIIWLACILGLIVIIIQFVIQFIIMMRGCIKCNACKYSDDFLDYDLACNECHDYNGWESKK